MAILTAPRQLLIVLLCLYTIFCHNFTDLENLILLWNIMSADWRIEYVKSTKRAYSRRVLMRLTKSDAGPTVSYLVSNIFFQLFSVDCLNQNYQEVSHIMKNLPAETGLLLNFTQNGSSLALKGIAYTKWDFVKSRSLKIFENLVVFGWKC